MNVSRLLKRLALRLKAHWLAMVYKEGFDAEWYRAAYPDVARAGIKPAVHYWAYGRAEGRLPSLGAKPPVLDGYPVNVDPLDRLNQILWNGFEHWAHPRLVEQADSGCDRAAWHLASWHYARGHWGDARRWLALMEGGKYEPRRLLAWVKLCAVHEDVDMLRTLLADSGARAGFGLALPFAEANAAPTSKQRLAALNGLYDRHGLLPPIVADQSRGFALNNISTSGAGSKVSASDKQPLISVVMAAYNASRTIEMALNCILEQTWQRLEVIVVDDASDDETLKKVQTIAEGDARVRWVSSDSNAGAYAARNRGVGLARGEFVTVHDSDDWSHPQKLEWQMKPLQDSPETVASYSWWVRVTEDMRFLGSWMLGEPFLELNQSSWLIRRSALSKVGPWDEVKVGGDMEFAIRLQHHYGHRALVSVLPEVPLAFSLTESGSLTRTKATHISTLFHGLRRQYREGYAWWHRHSEGKPVMVSDTQTSNQHPFPLPLGNWREAETDFDALLVANFAVEGPALRQVMTFLDSQWWNGRRVCLLQWPERDAWHGNTVADEVFSWCLARGVHFAHFGITLRVGEVLFSDSELWLNPPSKTVLLEGEAFEVSAASGDLGPSFSDIAAYFRQGGIAWEPAAGLGAE